MLPHLGGELCDPTCMRIALDAMGGDLGLEVTIGGAADFVKTNETAVLLVGDPHKISPLVRQHDTDRLIIVPATGLSEWMIILSKPYVRRSILRWL